MTEDDIYLEEFYSGGFDEFGNINMTKYAEGVIFSIKRKKVRLSSGEDEFTVTCRPDPDAGSFNYMPGKYYCYSKTDQEEKKRAWRKLKLDAMVFLSSL